MYNKLKERFKTFIKKKHINLNEDKIDKTFKNNDT